MERVNFLTEASRYAASDPDLVNLAQYYGSEADLAAKKSMIRTKPNNTFCKNCKVALVPPVSAVVSVNAESVTIECQLCHTRCTVYNGQKPSQSETQHWRFMQEVHGHQLVDVPG
jgi:RNase P subunit RPR2